LNQWKIAQESCVVVMPPDHRLAPCNSLTAQDLDGETVLFGERCGGFAHRLRTACGERFVQRPCGGSWIQMLDLVRAGLGLALLPDGLALSAGLVARPLVQPKLERSILLTAVAGRRQSPAVANLIKLCRARAPRAPA
jgi:DNA-binding transcriptional LysR family regulator